MKRLLILLVLAGCLDRSDPQRFKDACREKGGLVVLDGHPVCERVQVCEPLPGYSTMKQGSVCRDRQDCTEAPWHCELPAEAN